MEVRHDEEDEEGDEEIQRTFSEPYLEALPPGECLCGFRRLVVGEGVGMMGGVELMEHGIERIDAGIFRGDALFLLFLPLLEAQFLLSGDVAVDGALFLAYLTTQRVDVGSDGLGDMFLLLFGGSLLLGYMRHDDRHDAVRVEGGLPHPTLVNDGGGGRIGRVRLCLVDGVFGGRTGEEGEGGYDIAAYGTG